MYIHVNIFQIFAVEGVGKSANLDRPSTDLQKDGVILHLNLYSDCRAILI